jgi:hypothetical protein
MIFLKTMSVENQKFICVIKVWMVEKFSLLAWKKKLTDVSKKKKLILTACFFSTSQFFFFSVDYTPEQKWSVVPRNRICSRCSGLRHTRSENFARQCFPVKHPFFFVLVLFVILLFIVHIIWAFLLVIYGKIKSSECYVSSKWNKTYV